MRKSIAVVSLCLISFGLSVQVLLQPARAFTGTECACIASEAKAASASQRGKSKSHNCFAGVPVSNNASSKFVFLHNDGYDVGYSEDRNDPLWAAYTLRGDQALHEVKRPKNKRFATDNRVSSGVTHNDYTNSHYDRGHMAPSDAIGKWFGKVAQDGTFIVTNICPQKHKVNDEVWGGLEAAEVYELAPKFQQVWVMAGPIFGTAPSTLNDKGLVCIPDRFYKVIVEDDDNEPQALAVVMSQDDAGPTHKLSEFTKTVREIEDMIDLDLFPDLPATVREKIETEEADANVWPLDLVLNPKKIRSAGESE